MLTRNSSAPDRQAAGVTAMALPPMNQPPPPLPAAPYPHPSSQQDALHKTMSDSFVWGAGPAAAAAGTATSDEQLPVLPSCAPWTRPQQRQSRSDLYFHLAAIFPKELVERAMDLMPHETNPQVLCKYILSNMNK